MKDHMFLDGLEDAYDRGKLMGAFAEEAASAYQFTREDQDAYAIASLGEGQQGHHGGSIWSRDQACDREDAQRRGPG